MIRNPSLKVQVENGYYDLATPFFAMEWTTDHMNLPDELRGNSSHNFYEAGHMMYVHGGRTNEPQAQHRVAHRPRRSPHRRQRLIGRWPATGPRSPVAAADCAPRPQRSRQSF